MEEEEEEEDNEEAKAEAEVAEMLPLGGPLRLSIPDHTTGTTPTHLRQGTFTTSQWSPSPSPCPDAEARPIPDPGIIPTPPCPGPCPGPDTAAEGAVLRRGWG